MGQKGNFLGKINREFEEREVRRRASELGISYIDLSRILPNFDLLKIISREDAEKFLVFPLDKSGRKLQVAITDPSSPLTQEFLNQLSQKFSVEVFLGSLSGMQPLFSFYDSSVLQKKSVQTQTEFSEEKKENVIRFISEFSEILQKKILDMPAETALNDIKIAALQARVSDIHFEPSDQSVKLRFRIDGVLHDLFEIPFGVAKRIITRIKYEAGMKSNISDIPQDGHLDFEANGRIVDLRVSTVPTPFCESAVIRVLDSKGGVIELSRLGFPDYIQSQIEKSLKKTNGMILVTGPTGSGKTTTLYSLLTSLNTGERKIVTLEAPIEYRLPGVLQSQVDEKRKYDFEEGFTALLRHDPDIIFVGEIRTLQTAKMASESSLTGHLVLSSLHTNSAPGAISRLRNLGLENYNIAPTLNFVLAQRLVRVVRPMCAEKVPLPNDPKLQAAFARLKSVFPNKKLSKFIYQERKVDGVLAYEGRTVVTEAFFVDENIEQMIFGGKSVQEIQNFLVKNTSFLTLFEDGLLKVLEGKTTLEELYRVVGDYS